MSESTSILADGHVHFHRGYDLGTFLRSAVLNFAQAAASLNLSRNSPALLLMTEGSGEQSFRAFEGMAGQEVEDGWRFERTHEELSLRVDHSGRSRLWLVASRQIAVAEDLEVLALVCAEPLPDGRPLGETLAAVRRAGALAVIPWGFGKWWLRRGRLLKAILNEENPADFFLGDSGGRPWVAPTPRLFEVARENGIRVLPGSDPLPLRGQDERAGSCGFVVTGRIDPTRPAASLQDLLSSPAVEPVPFGRRQRLLPFLRQQLAMQRRKLHGGARI